MKFVKSKIIHSRYNIAHGIANNWSIQRKTIMRDESSSYLHETGLTKLQCILSIHSLSVKSGKAPFSSRLNNGPTMYTAHWWKVLWLSWRHAGPWPPCCLWWSLSDSGLCYVFGTENKCNPVLIKCEWQDELMNGHPGEECVSVTVLIEWDCQILKLFLFIFFNAFYAQFKTVQRFPVLHTSRLDLCKSILNNVHIVNDIYTVKNNSVCLKMVRFAGNNPSDHL